MPFISLSQCKEELINTAKAIAANGKAIRRFALIIAKNCLDTRFSQDLMSEADQIPVLSTQVSPYAGSLPQERFYGDVRQNGSPFLSPLW